MKDLATKLPNEGERVEIPRLNKRQGNKITRAILALAFVILCLWGLNNFFNAYYLVNPVIFQSPIRIRGSIYPIKINEPELDQMINEEIEKAMITPTPTSMKSRENDKSVEDPTTWRGEASIYTEEGCLGCSSTLTMANGEKFTNQKVIVAFNKLPLNSKVKVTNLSNGLFVEARVTDRGGFEKYNRIIDLGKATADAINCKGLCSVQVEEI